MGCDRALDFVRGSRSSNVAVALTVGVSAFLLSALACMLYDFWADAAAQAALAGMDMGAYLSETGAATAVLYAVVLAMATIALMLIVRTAFTASMQNRVHQLGLLASIGATPRQLSRMLFREGARLSLLPICIGTAAGGIASLVILQPFVEFSQRIGVREAGSIGLVINPLVIIAVLALMLVVVAVSAGSPARKLSKTTPLRAIGGVMETPCAESRKRSMLTAPFGIEGELEAQSLRQRRLSLRSATFALVLSFVVLGLFLSFMTASTTSVNRTYYERYGVSWDYAIDFSDASQETLDAARATLLESTPRAGQIVQDASDKGARLYVSLDDAASLEELASALVAAGIEGAEITDMVDDRRKADGIWHVYTLLVGTFCFVLALIGIAGIAAQAVNSTNQRKREFARLRSIGLTPGGACKMLAIEALAVVGKPLAISTPLVVLVAVGLATLSRNTAAEFAGAFPFGAVILYVAAVLLVVALAYGIGATRVVRSGIARALRDDSLL